MNPPNPAISPAPGKRGIRRILWRIFLGCIVVVLLVFGFWRLRLAGSVHDQVAAIREKGLPVDWKDLEHWPMAVPDEQNAALIFDQAFEMTDSNSCYKVSRLDLPVRGAPITNREEIAGYVHPNLAAMEIIYGITNASSSRYPINYMDGPDALLPHLPKIKTLAQLFACDALLKADQNDPNGAVRDIEASIKLSHSLDAEPILMSQLVSGAVLAISTESLERTLARTALTDEQMQQLSGEFSSAEATNRCWIGLVGERAFTGEYLRMLNDDPRAAILLANKQASGDEQTDVPPRHSGYLMRLSGFWVRDRNFFLRSMDSYISALAVTPPASLRFTNEFNNIVTNAHKGFYIMSAMELPAFNGVVIRDTDARARLRTAIAAMAIERWRAAHGDKIPDSLAELVPNFLPAVPEDPYDGEPLRFKKLAKGYVVYSIGSNGQDDGGKERIPYSVKVSQAERNRYDITFIVER